MTDREKPETQKPAEDAAPASAPAEQAENAGPDPFAVVEKLNQENAELKDKVLRTLAEMENLRRRTEREVSDARTYGVTKFARDMLEFADNIHRALANVPADAREGEGPLKTLVDGIEAIERNFATTLGRHGIKRLEPQGQKFDPNMHEALFEIPNPNVPTGTVAQVVEAGYAIGDRVLRPAKVGVARGGPKAAPADETKTSGAA